MFVHFQRPSLHVHGNVIQVAGNFEFGMWIENQKPSNGHKLVNVDTTRETENTPARYTVTSESITDGNIDSIEAPMSSETFTVPDTNPKPITPAGSLNSSQTTESSDYSPTLSPSATYNIETAAQCAKFTPIAIADASEVINSLLNKTASTFENCCSGFSQTSCKI